jgi:hypothetical protein
VTLMPGRGGRTYPNELSPIGEPIWGIASTVEMPEYLWDLMFEVSGLCVVSLARLEKNLI